MSSILATLGFSMNLLIGQPNLPPQTNTSIMMLGQNQYQVTKPKTDDKRVIEETKVETPKVEEPKVTAPIAEVYVVQSGDYLELIATKYNVTWQRLYDKNTTLSDPNSITVGQEITIPLTDEVLESRIAPLAVVTQTISSSQVVLVARSTSSGNTYSYGWCTWWVKEKRPDIPNNWGNAGYSWISSARASGYTTSSVPRAGAIGVMAGHVVYVESVNGDTVNISEMGWNYTSGSLNYRSVPASSFQYIY